MTFVEQNLEFDFDENYWKNVIQYDKTPAFEKLEKSKIGNGSKGVDFIGIFENKGLFIFEVKDYRKKKDGGIPNNKEKDLKEIIAQKVRDSLAGILGGTRNSTHYREEFESYLSFFKSQKSIRIIFWMEQEFEIWNDKKERKWRNNLLTNLKTKLHWLSPRVLILNSKSESISGLTVSFKT